METSAVGARSAAEVVESLHQFELAPVPRRPLALFRAGVLPWLTPVESHQRVATSCPAPVSDKWTR